MDLHYHIVDIKLLYIILHYPVVDSKQEYPIVYSQRFITIL